MGSQQVEIQGDDPVALLWEKHNLTSWFTGRCYKDDLHNVKFYLSYANSIEVLVSNEELPELKLLQKELQELLTKVRDVPVPLQTIFGLPYEVSTFGFNKLEDCQTAWCCGATKLIITKSLEDLLIKSLKFSHVKV